MPNSWFGYRCRSLKNSFLFCLCCQHVILVSELCQLKHSLFIFSRNCLTTTNVIRLLITSVECRPESRKLLLQKIDWWSLYLLPLAKFYNRVCSAIMFISSNSIINWNQAVISLNALGTLVFWMTIRRVWALTAISCWHSLHYNTVCAIISNTLAYSEHLYMKAPAGCDNNLGIASFSMQRADITRASFPSMSFSSSWSLRPYSRAWLRTDSRSSHITGQFTPKSGPSLAISLYMDFSQRVYKSCCHLVAVMIFVMYVSTMTAFVRNWCNGLRNLSWWP